MRAREECSRRLEELFRHGVMSHGPSNCCFSARVPRDPSRQERLRKNALLSPERRVLRFLQAHNKAGRRS